MNIHPIRNQARWPLAVLALLGLLGLARSAHAQSNNTGNKITNGSIRYANGLTNSGTIANNGTGSRLFTGSLTNTGSFASAAGTDEFQAPAGSPAAGAPVSIAGSTAPSFTNLTLNNGATQVVNVTNTAGANVAGVLTLSNAKTTTLTTVAGAIRLGNSATVAGTLGAANAYVDGYLGKAGTTSFSYPLGATNAAGNGGNTTAVGAIVYSPITLSSPGGTAVRYVADATPNPTSYATQPSLQLTNVSSREYYPIGTVGAAANSTITIPYGNFGPSGAGTPYVADPSKLTIAGYTGTQWVNLSNTLTNSYSTTNKTVTVTLPVALSTSYQYLALASTNNVTPLPVQLTAFAGIKQGADGLLSWQTASELNSAYFELQASADGSTWQVLTKVAGAGTGTTAHTYAFIDKQIARYGVSLVYYRLRQVDLDGTATFSPVRTLAPDALAWSVGAYPNPFAGTLSAQLTTSETSSVTATLFDTLGRVVLRREVAAAPGTELLSLDGAGGLAPSTYILLVRQGTHTATLHLSKN